MNIEVRGAAKAIFKDGKVKYWLPAPDIGYKPDEAEIFAAVFKKCLQGDIERIEPVEVQVERFSDPGQPRFQHYKILGEVAASSSLEQPTA